MQTKLAQIPEDKLIVNRWYVGRGRNGNVAKWVNMGQGRKTFLTIGETFKSPNLKDEGYHHEDPKEGGCFQPFALIDEGTVVESVGTDPGWDRHYANSMSFPLQALLESLEWSASKEGPSDRMGDRGVLVSACPACYGVKPDDRCAGAYSVTGHNLKCPLAAALARS
ncbi:MAG: hypothetical protein ACOYB3_01040 [Azonexus sp.]